MKSKFTLLLSALVFSFVYVHGQNLPIGSVCSDPIALQCGVSMNGSTQGIPNDNATSGAGLCLSNLGTGGQMWYSYSDAGNNLLTISTCGTTTMDTKIHVYSGSCGALNCVTSNDDACGMQSTVSFVTNPGENYLIRVGGFGSISGIFGLTVGCGNNTGGCTDPGATNYDPTATFNDASCLYDGCTDPAAINYNPAANQDDGSCEFCGGEGSFSSQLYLCTFSNGSSVSLTIINEDGSVAWQSPAMGNNQIEYFDVCLQTGVCYTAVMTNTAGQFGWSNGYFWINSANNQVVNESLNPDATTETVVFSIDGTCSTVFGCTNPEATNFNSLANVDDGSCITIPNCENGTLYSISHNPGSFPSESSYQVVNEDGDVVLDGSLYLGYPYLGNNIYTNYLCLEDGCYTILMFDSFGDGWNGGYLEFVGNGVATQFSISSGNSGAGVFGVNSTECLPNINAGCINPSADNYDPSALYDDGSCIFSGCMDNAAINFDPMATTDDGSCEYCNGEGSALASLYICTFSNGNQVELQIVDDEGNEIYYAYGLGNSAIVYASVCLLPGVCYTANMINNTGANGWYNGYFWINLNGIQIINDELDAGAQFQSVQFSIDGTCGPLFGCTDPSATNYDPAATSDNGSCIYPVWGCTDSIAINFNPSASEDDGSCVYSEDCTQTFVMFQFNPGTFANEATYDVIDANGQVVAQGYGLSNQYACLADGCYTVNMYDTFGDGWDGSGYLTITASNNYVGVFELSSGFYGSAGFGINAEGCVASVTGCTDPTAINYNPIANEDDGSCVYPESCDNGNLINVTIITQSWGSEVSWSLVGEDGATYASGSGYGSWNSYTTYACIPDGCYQFIMNDSWGDGWNGGYYYISSNVSYNEGSLFYGNLATDLIGINSDCGVIEGCTDAAAINFNPAATWDDGSCLFNDGSTPGIGLGLEMGFSVYPNPANAGILVNLNDLDPSSNLEVRFLGVDGKVLRNEFFSNNDSSRLLNMDISELSAGFYFVQVVNGNQVKVKTIVKE
jgi:hypothetical protein